MIFRPGRQDAGTGAWIAAVTLGLLLAGCTSVVPVSKPGSTEADWRQVDFVCLRETTGTETPQRGRRLYEACLRANGWTVEESGAGAARRTYEYKP